MPKPKRKKTIRIGERHHDFKVIPMRMIEVDHEMIPLVAWLNDLYGTFTLWSCQGDRDADEESNIKKYNAHGLPYVMFTCCDLESLSEIKDSIRRCTERLEDSEHMEFSSSISNSKDSIGASYSIHMSSQAVVRKLIDVVLPTSRP